MKDLTLAIAALCTACTFTGKHLGPSSSPAIPASSEDSDSGSPATSAPPGAPQDPWLAVDKDQPKRRSARTWWGSEAKTDCSAAHDHCLDPDLWFLVLDDERAHPTPYTHADTAAFGADGAPLYAENVRERRIDKDYVAFHTVPATRANLVAGAIAFGIQREDQLPADPVHAMLMNWHYGVVESVDVDVGVYKLVGDKDTLTLPGARVAVLEWVPGGKVEILGGKAKDQLAVTAANVFLPEK